ncbi:putative F-box/LRR-repeat protein 9 [Apium graveolens]|uniref:putative F-box/LRR-repeat protein 9 n=1 Tax=Apium graveolens TaxID=4045 RepID=UPI003D7A73D3
MVKEFQSLDKVRVDCIHISDITIELAGSCCPRSISLKLNNQGYGWPRKGVDEDALAIAETMRGRRHLRLFENRITSDGLLAILKNCPHLESLDIHQCFDAVTAGTDIAPKLFEIRGGEGSKAPI